MNEKAIEVTGVAKTGQQFYSWATISSFSGATGVIVLIWKVLESIGPSFFASNVVPLIVSFLVISAFAVLTEPPKEEGETKPYQKRQKVAETIVNSFLVYSVVVGLGV